MNNEFPLNRYYNKWDMKRAFDNMLYQGSNTATGDALEMMRTWAFSTENGMRDDKSIPKVSRQLDFSLHMHFFT